MMRNTFRRALSLLLPVLLCSGCALSTPKRALTVQDVESGEGVPGLEVERRSPVGILGKVFNPVGAAYFPYRVVETTRTNGNGEAYFRESSSDDDYGVITQRKHLLINVWGETIRVDAPAPPPEEGTHIRYKLYRDPMGDVQWGYHWHQ